MRRLFVLPLLLLVAIGLGWTGLWVYASSEAGRRLDAWLATEDAQGRHWTCPNRVFGGFPFALGVECQAPTFAGHALGQSVQGSVAHLAAEVALLRPTTVALTLRPPFTYRASDGGTDIRATWTALRIDLDDLRKIDAATLHGTNVLVDGAFGPSGKRGGQTDRLDATFRMTGERSDPTVDFDIAVGGTSIPAVDDLFGAAAPVDVALAGRLDRADIGDARTPEDVIDQWRKAGGRIDLARGKLVRGQSSVVANGVVGLDDAHRPQGKLDASFVGLGPVLKRYGINPDLAAAGALLSNLFGGGRKPQVQSDPGGISLPINLQNGRLGVGPVQTQIALPPVY